MVSSCGAELCVALQIAILKVLVRHSTIIINGAVGVALFAHGGKVHGEPRIDTEERRMRALSAGWAGHQLLFQVAQRATYSPPYSTGKVSDELSLVPQ